MTIELILLKVEVRFELVQVVFKNKIILKHVIEQKSKFVKIILRSNP